MLDDISCVLQFVDAIGYQVSMSNRKDTTDIMHILINTPIDKKSIKYF